MSNQSRILKINSVVGVTALSRASIYRAVQAGSFPAPLKIGKRASGWEASAIENWIETQRIVAVESPFHLEAERNAPTFADPRSLFEWGLWKHVDPQNATQLDIAIRSCSTLAKEYQHTLSAHEKNMARGIPAPQALDYSSERQQAHSEILERAREAWSAYHPQKAGAPERWRRIWNEVFTNSSAWVDTKNIVVLRVLLGHLLDVVCTADRVVYRLSHAEEHNG